jgi:hypothetical protein
LSREFLNGLIELMLHFICQTIADLSILGPEFFNNFSGIIGGGMNGIVSLALLE